MLRVNPFQGEIATDEVQEGKKYRARSNIKACVSVHCRAAAQCHSKWPSDCRDFRHPARVDPMSPDLPRLAITTKPEAHTNQMTRHITQPRTAQIAQVEYQG